MKVGTDWMIHTSRWADIMDNPEWPADIKNFKKQHIKTPVTDADNEEDASEDGMTDIEEVDDDDVEFSISDVELEEDEVDHLVKMME